MAFRAARSAVLGASLLVVLLLSSSPSAQVLAGAAPKLLTQQECVLKGQPLLKDVNAIGDRLATGCTASQPQTCCANINGFFGTVGDTAGDLYGCLCYDPIFKIVGQQVLANAKAQEAGIKTDEDSIKVIDFCQVPYMGKHGCASSN